MMFSFSKGNGRPQVMTPLLKMNYIQEENEHIIMNYMLFHSAILNVNMNIRLFILTANNCQTHCR